MLSQQLMIQNLARFFVLVPLKLARKDKGEGGANITKIALLLLIILAILKSFFEIFYRIIDCKSMPFLATLFYALNCIALLFSKILFLISCCSLTLAARPEHCTLPIRFPRLTDP